MSESTIRKEIRRDQCKHCSGTGNFFHQSNVKCTQCVGLGWYGAANREIICELCDASGSIQKEYIEACTECEGRGFSIRIMQVIENKYDCLKCPKPNLDDGSQNSQAFHQKDCGICSGSGYDAYFQTCGFCKGTRQRHGWSCPHCTGMGFVEVHEGIAASEIKPIMDRPCEHCDGIGKVWALKACEVCNDLKYIKKVTEIDITPSYSKGS